MPGIDKEAELLLVKAAEDEAVLAANIPDGPFGFHVQQAVEKLLKALLCQLAIKYKRTHDLEYLTHSCTIMERRFRKEQSRSRKLKALEWLTATTRCRRRTSWIA